MTIEGTLKEIHETEKVTATFQKRTFVLEHGDNPNYLENCLFEFHQVKVDELDKFHEGQRVKVQFNLKGRKEKNGTRYFNTLNAWKIEAV